MQQEMEFIILHGSWERKSQRPLAWWENSPNACKISLTIYHVSDLIARISDTTKLQKQSFIQVGKDRQAFYLLTWLEMSRNTHWCEPSHVHWFLYLNNRSHHWAFNVKIHAQRWEKHDGTSHRHEGFTYWRACIMHKPPFGSPNCGLRMPDLFEWSFKRDIHCLMHISAVMARTRGL